MKIDLEQIEAADKLKNGNILVGNTGSGKSRTCLYFYFNNIGSDIPLYIITVAKKRDSKEWEDEITNFSEYKKPSSVFVDSWNNIKKYENVKGCFFIFDEKHLGGKSWTKSFYKIVKHNKWVVLTATPGDNWSEYIPIFVANGFYRNESEFIIQHCILKPYVKYRQIERYVGVKKLEKLRRSVVVELKYKSIKNKHVTTCLCDYNKNAYHNVLKKRFNVFENKPISNIGELMFCIRRVSIDDDSRLKNLETIIKKHNKIILFYNYNFERDMILSSISGIDIFEYNGRVHQDPIGDRYLLIVNYSSGAEGWNSSAEAEVFFSLSYSYKTMKQSAGRIDRRNTTVKNIYYYVFMSESSIDKKIIKALKEKKDFNASLWARNLL